MIPFICLIFLISMAALGVSGYHALLAQEEYYHPDKHGERPGFFVGRGARLLLGDDNPTVSKEWHRSLLRRPSRACRSRRW